MKPTKQGRVLSLQRTTLRSLTESELSAADGGTRLTIGLPTTLLPPCGTTTNTTGTFSHLPPRCVSLPVLCVPTRP